MFHVIPTKDCCCFVLMRNEKHDYILKYISYHIAASNESPPCKKKALDASFTQRERKYTSETARAEVIRYRAKDTLSLTENAITWWRSQDKELPLLSTLAKRYLCIPGTSVQAEQVFSTVGDIVNSQRSIWGLSWLCVAL